MPSASLAKQRRVNELQSRAMKEQLPPSPQEAAPAPATYRACAPGSSKATQERGGNCVQQILLPPNLQEIMPLHEVDQHRER